jgi:hypothetical protein
MTKQLTQPVSAPEIDLRPRVLTPVEILDKVSKHLLKQKAKSLGDEGQCAYRGDGGLRCAIGVLIKDEHYSERLEGLRVSSAPVMRALVASGVVSSGSSESLLLLSSLQSIHDGCPPNNRPGALSSLCSEYWRG